MTLNEIEEIFAQSEVMFIDRTTPLYQFYKFEDGHRGAGAVSPKNLASLVQDLEGFKFLEYAPGQIPVFVRPKTNLIQGT
jgi:hypothetical protein